MKRLTFQFGPKVSHCLLASAFCLFGLLAGCGSLTPAERQEAERERLAKEVQDEVALGRKMAAKLLGHLGAYDKDEAAQRYVELVGNVLVAKVGRPELTFRFAILASSTPNAYATPGGFVFVTRGLLKTLSNESELAGVLGHEIAHVNERHMYKELRPQREVGAAESIVRMLGMGGSTLGGSMTKLVDAGMKALLKDGLGKEKEKNADEIGSLYLQAAGYPADGLLTYLKRNASLSKVETAEHASFPERARQLQNFFSANGVKPQRHLAEAILSQRFQRSLAGVKR